MIVYIASFPRSGNSLIQNVMEHAIQIPFSSMHRSAKPIRGKYIHSENWTPVLPPSQACMKKSIQDKMLYHYDRKGVNPRQKTLFLAKGCEKYLSEDLRKNLAQKDDVIILKTHNLPYSTYFPGEYIIQPYRHPGPVLRSYVRQVSENRKTFPSSLLRWAVLLGLTRVGSYLRYHRSWARIHSLHTIPFLILDYENMAANMQKTAQKIAGFLGLESDPEATFICIEDKKRQNPRQYSFGSNAGWESAFSRYQLHFIQRIFEKIPACFKQAIK